MPELLVNSLRQRPGGVSDMILNGAITNVATTITVAASPGVPANLTAGNVRIRLDDEFMLVTAIAGLVLTVTRECEDAAVFPKTTHSDLTPIYLVLTANGVAQYTREHGGIGGTLYLAANYT